MLAQDAPDEAVVELLNASPQGGGTIRSLLRGRRMGPAACPRSRHPREPGPQPAHEGRCAALENFLAFVMDALTPLGGYPGNDDDGRALQCQRDRAEMSEDFVAAVGFLGRVAPYGRPRLSPGGSLYHRTRLAAAAHRADATFMMR